MIKTMGLEKDQIMTKKAGDIFRLFNSKKFTKYFMSLVTKLAILHRHRNPPSPPGTCLTNIPMGPIARAWVLSCRKQIMLNHYDEYSDTLLALATPLMQNMEEIMAAIVTGKSLLAVDRTLMHQWHERVSTYIKAFEEWKKRDLICYEGRTKSSLHTLYHMRNHYWKELRMHQMECLQCEKEILFLENVLKNNLGQMVFEKHCEEAKALREPDIKKFTLKDASAALHESVHKPAEGASSMYLMGELLLDPIFTFEKNLSHNEFMHLNKVNSDADSPFWKNIAGDMLLPIPVYNKLTLLFEDLKKILDNYSKTGEQKQKVAEILNVPCMHDQLCSGKFTTSDCQSLIRNVALLMVDCYPVEKRGGLNGFLEEVKAQVDKMVGPDGKLDAHAFVQGARLLVNKTKRMSVEMANVTLKKFMSLTPFDRMRNVHHIFMNRVQKNTMGISIIKKAFQKHLGILKEKQVVTPEDVRHNKGLVINKVMVEVFFEMITMREALTAENVPETFIYSLHHVNYIRKHLESLIVIGSILNNLLPVLQGRNIHLVSFTSDVATLFLSLQSQYPTMEFVVKEILLLMRQTSGFTPDLIKTCMRVMLYCASPSNPVYMVLRKRIHQIVRLSLESFTWPVVKADVRNIHPMIVEELKKLTARKITMLKKLNQETHKQLYCEFCV
jgi:hypothetical protein